MSTTKDVELQAPGATAQAPGRTFHSSLAAHAEGHDHHDEHEPHGDAHPTKDAKPDPTPPRLSFVAVICYSILTVTSFTICLPTSKLYVSSFGVSDSLAGLMVGLTPIFSGLMQLPLIPVLRKYPLKHVLMAGCVINMLASAMYSLAAVSGSVVTLFVARCISGSVGGPTYASSYVVKTTGLKTRSQYMLYVGIGIGIGYGLGPLAGLVVEVVCGAANWNAPALDSSTAPGWVMVVLYALEFLFIGAQMVEPPKLKPKPSGGGGGPPPTLPYARLAVCYAIVFVVPFNVGMWDVAFVFMGVGSWGWSIEITALALGLIELAVVPVNLLPIAKHMTDRNGIVAFLALLLLAPICFVDYPHESQYAAFLWIVGAFLLLIAAGETKGFVFGLVSKMPPVPPMRQKVMSTNSTFYMLGRGVGAIVSPYLLAAGDSKFAITLLAVNGATLLLALACYSILKVPPKPPS